MIRTAILFGCVAALLVASGSGCCVNRGFGDCGSCGSCGGPFGGHLHNAMSCNAGCGDVYVDEWISDPPDCCDPCDACGGGYVGPQSCCYRPFSGLVNFIVGHRYNGCDSDCCAGGSSCDSCGGHGMSSGCSSCGGHSSEGHVIESGDYEMQPAPPAQSPSPTPAGTASTPKRYSRPYNSRAMPSRPVNYSGR